MSDLPGTPERLNTHLSQLSYLQINKYLFKIFKDSLDYKDSLEHLKTLFEKKLPLEQHHNM